MKDYLDAQTRARAPTSWSAAGWPTTTTPTTSRSASSTPGAATCAGFFSSPEADRLARGGAHREPPRGPREASTGGSSSLLLDEAVLIPLFHEVDYRIAGPGVRGRRASQQPSVRQLSPRSGSRRRRRLPCRTSGAAASSTCRSAASCTTSIPRRWRVQRAGRDDAPRLRDADAGRRGRARRSVARLRGRFPKTAARASASACGGACASTTAARSPPATSVTPSSAFSRRPRATAGFLLAPIRGAQSLIDGKASDLEGFHIVSPFGVRDRAGTAAVVLPRPRVVPGRRHRPRGDRRPRRELAQGLRRHGRVPRRRLRAGKAAGAGEKPRLLARGLPEERGARLPVRRPAGGDPLRVPRRPASPSRRTSSRPTPKPCARTRASAPTYRESPSLVTYFVVFNAHRGAVHRRAGAPRARAGDRRRRASSGGRSAGTRFRRTASSRPASSGTSRSRGAGRRPRDRSRARTPSRASRSRSRPS